MTQKPTESQTIYNIVRHLEAVPGGHASVEAVLAQANEMGVHAAEELIDRLIERGDLVEHRAGRLKTASFDPARAGTRGHIRQTENEEGLIR